MFGFSVGGAVAIRLGVEHPSLVRRLIVSSTSFARDGDFESVPASQLAVFPGTTHVFGLARTDLVLATVIPFLDAPEG